MRRITSLSQCRIRSRSTSAMSSPPTGPSSCMVPTPKERRWEGTIIVALVLHNPINLACSQCSPAVAHGHVPARSLVACDLCEAIGVLLLHLVDVGHRLGHTKQLVQRLHDRVLANDV